MKCALRSHPERNSVRLQLKRNKLLSQLDEDAFAQLLELLHVQDGYRGERLIEQGGSALQQFFVIDGLLKRVITSPEGRELVLRFAGVDDMETCHDAWRQQTRMSYAIVCAARSRVAWAPMGHWCGFLARHPKAQHAFQERVAEMGAAITDHAVGLLMLDAPGRMQRFWDAYPELLESLPQRDLASHLNLSAETLCRLSRRGKLPARPPELHRHADQRSRVTAA